MRDEQAAAAVGPASRRGARRRGRPAARGRGPRGGRRLRVLAGRGPLVDRAAAAAALLGGGDDLRSQRGRLPRPRERSLVAPALTGARRGATAEAGAPPCATTRGAAPWGPGG